MSDNSQSDVDDSENDSQFTELSRKESYSIEASERREDSVHSQNKRVKVYDDADILPEEPSESNPKIIGFDALKKMSTDELFNNVNDENIQDILAIIKERYPDLLSGTEIKENPDHAISIAKNKWLIECQRGRDHFLKLLRRLNDENIQNDWRQSLKRTGKEVSLGVLWGLVGSNLFSPLGNGGRFIGAVLLPTMFSAIWNKFQSLDRFLETTCKIEKITKITINRYWLDLPSDKKYFVLPRQIGKLTALQDLDVDDVEELPKEIWQLTNLKNFLIRHSNLRKLPKEIGQLVNLQTLKIDCGLAEHGLEELLER